MLIRLGKEKLENVACIMQARGPGTFDQMEISPIIEAGILPIDDLVADGNEASDGRHNNILSTGKYEVWINWHLLSHCAFAYSV
jgi:hypothetical protein